MNTWLGVGYASLRLQEARLQILTKVISKREVENEAINNERIERIWQRKLQEREAMMDKIERRRQKGKWMLELLWEWFGSVPPLSILFF